MLKKTQKLFLAKCESYFCEYGVGAFSMKKVKVCFFIMIAAIVCCVISPVRGRAADLPESDSVERSALAALLYPKIEEAVSDYYQQYFTNIPGTAPYFVDVLSVEGEKSDSHSVNYASYKVKVQVSPYLGPHIPVGDDQITLRIGMTGEVQVEAFDHIKSYALPWNYQDSAKGPWPPME